MPFSEYNKTGMYQNIWHWNIRRINMEWALKYYWIMFMFGLLSRSIFFSFIFFGLLFQLFEAIVYFLISSYTLMLFSTVSSNIFSLFIYFELCNNFVFFCFIFSSLWKTSVCYIWLSFNKINILFFWISYSNSFVDNLLFLIPFIRHFCHCIWKPFDGICDFLLWQFFRNNLVIYVLNNLHPFEFFPSTSSEPKNNQQQNIQSTH